MEPNRTIIMLFGTLENRNVDLQAKKAFGTVARTWMVVGLGTKMGMVKILMWVWQCHGPC